MFNSAAHTSLHLPWSHDRLARRLAEFDSAARPGRLSLALQRGGDPLFVDYAGPGMLQTIDSTRLPRLSAGCFAKPITASLLSESVGAGQMEWTSLINDVLEIRGTAADNLGGVSVSHLLNHTHGLDASMIDAVPRTPHGFIDATALCEQLAPIRLSAPGEMYSYGNAGAWLAAAALEKLTGTPYSHLLSASRCIAWSDGQQTNPPSLVCPATGGSLALTMAQWLSFAMAHADSDPLSPDHRERRLASLRCSQAPLPGWSPSEQAACLGWKCYGGGWFGHTSNTSTSVAFLRFNPGDHIAIVMSGTNDIALFAFSCLFRDYLPELKGLKFPRRLTAIESESIRSDSYAGVYAQAKTQIRITRAADGRLSFSVASDDPGLCAPPQTLHAAENDSFFCDGRRTPEFSFIQFLRLQNRGPSFSHVWNGKQLWKREQSHPS